MGQSLLYPCGGVGVWQGVVVAGGGEGVEGMKRLHAGDGAWDHSDGVGRHQRHIVRSPAQRQRVVGRAGGSQDVMWSKGLQVVVSVVLRVLHLQGHDFLLLAVSEVIGGYAALRRQSVPSHLVPLVAFVVKGCECQDVEEQKRGSHSNRDTQLS